MANGDEIQRRVSRRHRWSGTSTVWITAAAVISLLVSVSSLLLGGQFGASASSAATWSKLSPSASPGLRHDASMVYDPDSHTLLLFGGVTGDASNPTYHNDTWEWNGTTWTNVTPASGNPSARSNAGMAYDPSTQQVVLFGGFHSIPPTTYTDLGDTWVWNGSTWTQAATTGPSARVNVGMAYDQHNNQLILFGGNDRSGNFNDTYEWTGSSWTKLSPPDSPTVRSSPSLVYDPNSSGLILFGGGNGLNFSNETWKWTGSDWSNVSPATSPPGRDAASMAYDGATSQVVLFGGYGYNDTDGGFSYSDTWGWNGSAWTNLNPSTNPGGISDAPMAYDDSSSQLILYGGYGSSDVGDTWLFGSSGPTPDTTAPTTTATYSNSYVPNTWTNQTVQVTLSATDNTGGSGVANTYYTIDNGAQQTYGSSAFSVSGQGTHTITYWSVDNANNTETANSATIKIDLTKPSTSASYSNSYTPDTWTNQTVSVTLASE